MKIIVNDKFKHYINNDIIDKENTIKKIFKKEIPEIDINRISINSNYITYNNNGTIVNLGYIKQNRDDEEYIYLTTTEIKMILRNSTVPINQTIIDNENIDKELKKHNPNYNELEKKDSEGMVLELHTHFIEVLDAETFFDLLVKNDDYFIDPNKTENDKDKYLVCGKNYTQEELIKALEYPMEHLSGIDKEDNGRGIKTVAFSELSKIVALRTNILKRKPIPLIPKDSNNKRKYKYGKEIEQDSKAILVARIRELLIASLNKLEREGVNYVELSYSRSDISTIFDKPIEPEKVKKPTKVKKPSKPAKPLEGSEDFEIKQEKYIKEYNEYLEKQKKYNEYKEENKLYLEYKKEYKRYIQELKSYKKFMKKIYKIKDNKHIDFKFLLSTQRDDWSIPKIHGKYFIPFNNEKIVTSFLNNVNKIEDKNTKNDILNEVLDRFIKNVDKNQFKSLLKERIDVLSKSIGVKKTEKIKLVIDKAKLDDISELLELFKDKYGVIVLYNILNEDLSFIQDISEKYPELIDISDIIKQESFKSQHIVGYDIMGYETKISDGEKIYLEQKIRSILNNYNVTDSKSGYSNKRIIRIHAGETRESSGNVLAILQLIKKIKSDPQYESIINDFEFRIGHGIYIYDNDNADKVVDLLVELGVIVEVNLSSNYSLDNVDEITDVPIMRYRDGSNNKEVKYVISTDGGGVYKTTVRQEGLLEQRYFPYKNGPTNSKKSSTTVPVNNIDNINNNQPESNIENHIDYENKESDFEDDNIIEEQVLNEFNNLEYILVKDFSIQNILNSDEISSEMGAVKTSIKNREFKKAKMQIISLQVLMNSNTNFKKTFIKMKAKITYARTMIYSILDNNIVAKDSRIYASLQRINKMSDRDLMINYYNIFEKGELILLLKKLVKSYDYKKQSYIDKDQLYSFSKDDDNSFYSDIKSKLSTMDEETIFRASNNIMMKSDEDKYSYINSLIDIINTIKKSNNIELSELKESLQYLDVEKTRYNLAGKTEEDINEFVRDTFINNRNIDELIEILSLRYKNINESGKNKTVEEFMEGDFENDRRFNR